MKKGVKVALVLAAAIGVAGVGMTIGGIAAGAVHEDTSGVGNNWLVRFLRDHTTRTRTYTTEIPEEDVVFSDMGEEITWEHFGPEEQISRIEVTAQAADVTVRGVEEMARNGDMPDMEDGTVSIRLCREQNSSSGAEYRVEDGVLYVDCNTGDDDLYRSGKEPELTICLPEETAFQMGLSVGAGNVELTDGVQLETLDADLGAGDLKISDAVCISEGAVLSCSAGNIEAGDMICWGGLEASVDLGDVYLGFRNLDGNLDVTMGTGSIRMDLPGIETDYDYDLSTGTGDITCGDHVSQSAIGASMQLTNNPGGSTITVRNGLGDIDISFVG